MEIFEHLYHWFLTNSVSQELCFFLMLLYIFYVKIFIWIMLRESWNELRSLLVRGRNYFANESIPECTSGRKKAKFGSVFFPYNPDALTILTNYLRQLFNYAQPIVFICSGRGVIFIIINTSHPRENLQYSVISSVFIDSAHICWATIMFQTYF